MPRLPPLRRRKDDIEILTEAFLKDFLGNEADIQVTNLDTATKALQNHDWPGNVRELRNLVELASHEEQRPIDLSAFLYLSRTRRTPHDEVLSVDTGQPFKVAKQAIIESFERQYITDLLERCDNNVSQAARDAGIERAYLQRLIKKLGLR